MIEPGKDMPLRVSTHPVDGDDDHVEVRLMLAGIRVGEGMRVSRRSDLSDVLGNLLARVVAQADGRHLDAIRGDDA